MYDHMSDTNTRKLKTETGRNVQVD